MLRHRKLAAILTILFVPATIVKMDTNGLAAAPPPSICAR